MPHLLQSLSVLWLDEALPNPHPHHLIGILTCILGVSCEVEVARPEIASEIFEAHPEYDLNGTSCAASVTAGCK